MNLPCTWDQSRWYFTGDLSTDCHNDDQIVVNICDVPYNILEQQFIHVATSKVACCAESAVGAIRLLE